MVEKTQSEEMHLWNNFISGDDDAFRSLFDTFVNQLFIYGLNFMYNKELIKDCVQDLFVKLYTDRKKLKPVSNVRVYLYKSLKNSIFNLFRKEETLIHIDTIEPVFLLETSIESQIIENEIETGRKKAINDMIKQLTPRQCEVLYYRYVEELSYEEICDLMKMNYQSVRNLLHRTISKLKSFSKTDY
ncbi:MAG: RNA polymerase sigma factor [Dysgonamonadaceae bacterium]|jgi:RNA polymerase sigma factor (sigma-70 family)|nr:RNA polymerase sigma factor [Dysgonamonadaceae bacterium]